MQITLHCGSIRLSIMLGLLLLAGCRDANRFVPPPPPKVTVATPIHKKITLFTEFTGRTDAIESVELRARVAGFLKEVHFEDGAHVQQGNLLYTIEQEPYEAALQAAQAELARAEANVANTKFEFEKTERLYKQNSAAEQELVNTKAAYDAAMAAKLAAAAAVTSAELDLGYSTITAPISGRTNRSLIDAGNLVGKDQSTLLTTIVRWDPIHVYFNVDERAVLQFLRRQASEGDRVRTELPVFLRLVDGSDYPVIGHVDYADNRIDPDTGTLRIRAVFPNPDEFLVPGAFVRVRVPSDPQDVILVPQVAVQRDLTGYFVLTVNVSNTVQRVDVEAGAQVENMRVIRSGLSGNERVIIRGLQRARPDIEVSAEEVELPVEEVASQPATQPASTPTPTSKTSM